MTITDPRKNLRGHSGKTHHPPRGNCEAAPESTSGLGGSGKQQSCCLCVAEAQLRISLSRAQPLYLLLHKFWTGELVRELDRVDLVSVVCEEMDHLKEKRGLVFTNTNPAAARPHHGFPAHGKGLELDDF